MGDLRAIPRVDIYGEDVARHVLRGEYRDIYAPGGVTGMTLSASRGGSGGNGGVISGQGYTSAGGGGGGASAACNSVTAAGGMGGNSGWAVTRWSFHQMYGNAVLRPGDMIAVTGI